jgi:hypothetical protein
MSAGRMQLPISTIRLPSGLDNASNMLDDTRQVGQYANPLP